MTYHRLDARFASPIQKLPVELLSHIFALATHDIDQEYDGPCPPFDHETVKFPVVLSMVNRHWRNVARATASLWTSICVTPALFDDDENDGTGSPRTLNTKHISSYLALSRKYPLDILIDARDSNWNFIDESEIPSEFEDPYTPLFTIAHMHATMSLILPHLSRWRTFSLLTDVWAPMYLALRYIQPALTTVGAPALESLTLMRCNDFVSYKQMFHPPEMKDPIFLHLGENSIAPHLILPRLRSLVLCGVHVDWASLPTILSHSQPGLDTLDLSYHCLEVRPSLSEFHQILSTCPRLEKLTVNGSGPCIPDNLFEGVSVLSDTLPPIPLPRLREITVGYRDWSLLDGQTVLELLDAPNAKTLTLEDGTLPDMHMVADAGSLLAYLGTGRFPPARGTQDALVAHTMHEGQQQQLPIDQHPSSASCHVSKGTPSTASTSTSGSPPHVPFPLLEEVSLYKVKSSPRQLHTFYGGLAHLRHLELKDMPLSALPVPIPAHACPCPKLRSLCIKGLDNRDDRAIAVFADALALARLRGGARVLEALEVHVGCTNDPELVAENTVVSAAGIPVEIVREVRRESYLDSDDEEEEGDDCEGEGDSMECGWNGEFDSDPYMVGGAFNDPVFDAHYAGRALVAH
ncbi:hypothetical protein H0H81_007431 [Sphagnurus paluster]|uniref:F-box domain-containing protein n=1 Tax=Sphagnurus paluster TaxID=117069 RepID=A0A9P7FT61_9AGAR|nr:hypothetical protein H0H81_007431 [Sphagnurus paluster]